MKRIVRKFAVGISLLLMMSATAVIFSNADRTPLLATGDTIVGEDTDGSIRPQANVNKTRDEAVAWCKAQIGLPGKDYDGAYGVQCVDLIRYYTSWLGKDLGIAAGDGGADNYATQSIPTSHYTRYGNDTVPQPGDIFVWKRNTYGAGSVGHVGVIYEVGSNYYKYIDYSGSTHRGALGTTKKDGRQNFTKIIRPNFKVAEVTPTGAPIPGGDRIIPDGDYIIANAGGAGKSDIYYLDIEGSAIPAPDDRNVALWIASPDAIGIEDAWTITYNGGYYNIRQKGTNMCLDLYKNNKARGTNVQVYHDNSADPQKWVISSNERNGYRIQAKSSGFSVDLASGTLERTNNIRVWSANDSDAESWLFIPYKPSQPISNGRYILLSAIASGWTMDVSGNSGDIPDGTNVQLWADAAGISQWNSFDFTALSNGYYKVIHAASGKALTVAGGSAAKGTNIALYGYSGSLSQQWAIKKNDYGYVLISRNSGMALDVSGGVLQSGTNIAQYRYNGGKNQAWSFVKAEYTVNYNANGGAGAPSSQKKYYNTNLVLAGTQPTRDGYIFTGWATTNNATSATYQPGGNYNANADITLYAVWSALPSAPTNVQAVPSSTTSITVSWDAVNGASGYQVWRRSSATGSFTSLGTYTTTSKVSTGLESGKIYYYKVRAYKLVNGVKYYGSFSSVVCMTTKVAKPENVKAVSASATSVKITWDAVSGATGYQVCRATSENGSYSILGYYTTTSKISKSLTTGTKYFYKVRAYKEVNGEKYFGAYADVVSAIPKPSKPSNVKATVSSATAVTVSWNEVAGATGYEVYRCETSNGTYVKLGTLTGTSRKCPGLTSGKTYYFKVRAYTTVNGTKVYGNYSSVVSATPKK